MFLQKIYTYILFLMIFFIWWIVSVYACFWDILDSQSFSVVAPAPASCFWDILDSQSFSVVAPAPASCFWEILDSQSFSVVAPAPASCFWDILDSQSFSVVAPVTPEVIPPVVNRWGGGWGTFIIPSTQSSQEDTTHQDSETQTQEMSLEWDTSTSTDTNITDTQSTSSSSDAGTTTYTDALLRYAQRLVEENTVQETMIDNMWNEDAHMHTSWILQLPQELPRTGTPITERTEIIRSPQVVTHVPQEDLRLAWSTVQDLNYWKQVLPEQDKNNSRYLVVPTSWLVIPVWSFDVLSRDYDDLINGREANISPALRDGALEYSWSSVNWYGEEWNKVIFAHSSYFRNALWRYKAHFQKIIELDHGEEIWIYEKNNLGEYIRYVYVTEKSYNTHPQDVEILLPQGGKELTLFTCTPVWGLSGRWIVRARYQESGSISLNTSRVTFDLRLNQKRRIDDMIDTLDDTKLYEVFTRVIQRKSQYESSSQILNYIELAIARRIVQ